MKCKLCGKPIELRPTAAERARRYGGEAKDYTQLFTNHAACIIKERQDSVSALIARDYK